MERLSRGSRELNPLEKRHGSEPAHSVEERWIAKAHHSSVENPHLETVRSPAVRSPGRLGPNVKVQLDPMAAARRNLHRARNYPTDVDRDSGLRQSTWNGCHWPVHAEPDAFPVKLTEHGLSPPGYPDDSR
jgi:hypothetical protein